MRPTITLVDGYKDSGRSGVARALADHLDAVHFVGQLNTTPAEFEAVMAYALNDIQHVVIERSWQFEQYCKTIGQGCYIRTEHSRMLDRLAMARDGYIIKCVPNIEVILFNAIDRGATDVELNHLRKQAHLWQRYSVPLLAHEFEDTMEPEMILGAVNTSCTNDGPGVGTWNPDNVYMIVGGRPKITKKTPVLSRNISFCGLENENSFWFTKQLEDCGVPEYKLYWINSVENDGSWTDHSFVNDLRPKRIFAIGVMAEEWCIKNNLTAMRVVHPSYHRQFGQGQTYKLAGILGLEIREERETRS